MDATPGPLLKVIAHPDEVFVLTDPYSFRSIEFRYQNKWRWSYTWFTHYSDQIVRKSTVIFCLNFRLCISRASPGFSGKQSFAAAHPLD